MAQNKPEIRLNVYTNHIFDDKADSYYSRTIKGCFLWGGGLEYMQRPNTGIKVSYIRLDTNALATYYDNNGIDNPVKPRDFDIAVSYIRLGSTKYFKVKPSIEPYRGAQAGVNVF